MYWDPFSANDKWELEDNGLKHWMNEVNRKLQISKKKQVEKSIKENDHSFLWNQSFVNLGFDDKKIRFKTNDYISSMIRQDNFQSGNHKDKSS